MAGIAGVDRIGKEDIVRRMLEQISYRGKDGEKIIETNGATLGAVWSDAQAKKTSETLRQQAAWDGSFPPIPDSHCFERTWDPVAYAASTPSGFFLARDPLGVRPLYYGKGGEGEVYFASEVKALLQATEDIREFPPGAYYTADEGIQYYRTIECQPESNQNQEELTAGLRLRLDQAVARRIDGNEVGSWLSGGLDSSVIAVLANQYVTKVYSFAAGTDGAPDLIYARQVAEYLGTEHREVVVTTEDLLKALPDVIYHLESFDAYLVRSSLTNYFVGKAAADYVEAVFSGEGGDELFAGYQYLKAIEEDLLPDELIDIIGRLHNTALQRVDRSANAHGLAVHVPFLDIDVLDYALQIPVGLKLHHDGKLVEKWIVRQALAGDLPEAVVWRTKSKFWQGAGVGELLAEHAETTITDAAFQKEMTLANGWQLSTKEELMYYRIFKEYFGEMTNLSWMGRTKGAARQKKLIVHQGKGE